MFDRHCQWFCVALAAQFSIPALIQPAMADSAPGATPWVVNIHPGQTPAEAVRAALRQAALIRDAGPARAILLRPTSDVDPGTPGAPRIIAGNVLTPSVNVAVAPGLAPTVQINFNAPNGASYATFRFQSPHGQTLSFTYFDTHKPQQRGSWTIQGNQASQGTADLYAEPGAWALTSVELIDTKNQKTTYDARRLARLFPSTTLNVINTGTPDFTPPVVESGKILTRNISVSRANARFHVSLTATDDISGVEYPIVVVDHANVYPGGLAVSNSAPVPLQSGTFTASLPTSTFAPALGIWKVVAYGATDAAGNLFLDDKPADIRATFGDETFRVNN